MAVSAGGVSRCQRDPCALCSTSCHPLETGEMDIDPGNYPVLTSDPYRFILQ